MEYDSREKVCAKLDELAEGDSNDQEIDTLREIVWELLDVAYPVERYRASFVAQAWIRDHAVAVDPQGPTEWDCTEYVAELGPEWLARAMENGVDGQDAEDFEGSDHDDLLRLDPAAPEWVREWTGPFETYVKEA